MCILGHIWRTTEVIINNSIKYCHVSVAVIKIGELKIIYSKTLNTLWGHKIQCPL